MSNQDNCYNCGVVLTKGVNASKEHIPPQNLFVGFGNKYKQNQITVPSCNLCNNAYSVADEEFRNLIGATSKHSQNDEITSKTTKSLMRKFPKSLEQINFIGAGLMTLTLNKDKIIDFHKKNFKGIFHKQYGYTLPSDYEILVNFDESDWTEGTLSVIAYLDVNFNWKHSGHPDVFKYIIQPFRENWQNKPEKPDLMLNNLEPYFASLMVYNKNHGVLVLAVKKELMKTNK